MVKLIIIVRKVKKLKISKKAKKCKRCVKLEQKRKVSDRPSLEIL